MLKFDVDKINMDNVFEFFFESEDLAVKRNKDYHHLLKTIVTLEAQRTKALKDIDQLKLIQKQALSDSAGFVEKLKRGDDIGAPLPQNVATIPVIDWVQYSESLPENLKKSIQENSNLKVINNEQSVPSQSSNSFANKSRGRYVDETKPDTFNRLWSLEEQKRLEELLIEYPPEPVEMQRFAKIAKALGNRTTKQVCSRVQKYFIKLRQAGLPIPGRIPRTLEKKSLIHRHHRNNHYLYRPSTFFPNNEVPVFMSEHDDAPGPSTNYKETIDNAYIDQDLNFSDDEFQENKSNSIMSKKIELLKRVKKDKEKGNMSNSEHIGYKCDYCEEEPILGTRWHCNDCSHSVDFCTDCLIAQLDSPKCHPLSHKLIAFKSTSRKKSELTQRNLLFANSFSDSKYLNDFKTEKRKVIIKTESEDSYKEESSQNYQNAQDDYCKERQSNECGNVQIKTEPEEDIYDRDYMVNNSECVDGYNYLDMNFLPK